jgi:hypothetical protein
MLQAIASEGAKAVLQAGAKGSEPSSDAIKSIAGVIFRRLVCLGAKLITDAKQEPSWARSIAPHLFGKCFLSLV